MGPIVAQREPPEAGPAGINARRLPEGWQGRSVTGETRRRNDGLVLGGVEAFRMWLPWEPEAASSGGPQAKTCWSRPPIGQVTLRRTAMA